MKSIPIELIGAKGRGFIKSVETKKMKQERRDSLLDELKKKNKISKDKTQTKGALYKEELEIIEKKKTEEAKRRQER